MKSKEALNDLICHTIPTDISIEHQVKCEQTIKKDLEVLDILNKYLFIRIMDIPAFDGTYIVSLLDKEDREWDYTCIFVNEEEKDKIKEWLEEK